MAPLDGGVCCPVSISNVHDRGTWIFTLLCCTYALPSTALEHSKHISISGAEARTYFKNIPRLKQTWFNVTDTNYDWTENKSASIADVFSKQSSYISSIHNPSLTKLLLIDSWAKKNRAKNNADREMESYRQHLNLVSAFSKKNNSSTKFRKMYEKRIVKPYDKKVFLYGKDDRLRIYPSLLRKFPYSNVVRLSTGCTGTLVTPQHVLTAAHCVHTGVDFRNNLEMLKVEIPDSMGVRAYYIEKIGIPARWLHPRNSNEHQASWDYAVVKLSYGVHGRSHFFPLAVPTAGVLNENLQFLGFPNNKDDLWLSVCPARSNKAMVDGNLILTRCDSAVGNSGAAVLSDDSREGKKIIGVLSSTMPVGRTPYYTPFSIITALTWAKLYDICAEIGEIGLQHRVCPPLETIPKPRRFHISNNVIPFFG